MIDQTAKIGGEGLHLSGKSTNHIWLMEDGEEPFVIGIRMDCGDSGTVYVTREQAEFLAIELMLFLQPQPAPGKPEEK